MDDTSKRSRFLSLILRHQPAKVGISLDEAGWADVDELLRACGGAARGWTPEALRHIVDSDSKGRYSFSGDGCRIRANQGHSVRVELGYTSQAPPALLFHGTARTRLNSIRARGLLKGARHHVHLSENQTVAAEVGRRYGEPIVLRVDSGLMYAEGFEFLLAANGVWLTDHVPAVYLGVAGAAEGE